MTKEEKRVQIALGTYLQTKWKECQTLLVKGDKLWAEGHKLYAEGDKLQAEGDKLYDEGDKLYDEGSKLWAEGHKLYAKGRLLFTNAVIEVYGKDMTIEWIDYNRCTLENGMVFE